MVGTQRGGRRSGQARDFMEETHDGHGCRVVRVGRSPWSLKGVAVILFVPRSPMDTVRHSLCTAH